jgi:hypothetical protein
MNISKSMALEIADNWDQMSATALSRDRRETLRECADLVRTLAGGSLQPAPLPTMMPEAISSIDEFKAALDHLCRITRPQLRLSSLAEALEARAELLRDAEAEMDR